MMQRSTTAQQAVMDCRPNRGTATTATHILTGTIRDQARLHLFFFGWFYFIGNILPEPLAFFKVFVCGLVLEPEYRIDHIYSDLAHLLCYHHRSLTAPSIRTESCSNFCFHIRFGEAFNEFLHRRKHLVIEGRRTQCNCIR